MKVNVISNDWKMVQNVITPVFSRDDNMNSKWYMRINRKEQVSKSIYDYCWKKEDIYETFFFNLVKLRD